MNIKVFSRGDKLPDLPGNLKEFSAPGLRARFGFKIESNGTDYYWAPASEQDFRSSEAERLGVKGEDIIIKQYSCSQLGPRDCQGVCIPGTGFCKLIYNAKEQYYYCACS